jgi:glycerol kinase
MRSPQPDHQLYLAIDQGGHSSRALVFDAQGRVVAQARQSIGVQRPRPGWVEQEAAGLVKSVTEVTGHVINDIARQGLTIKAAGLATQRSTIVCWDKDTGEALSPVISWQDRRAHQWMHGFLSQNDEVHRLTGLFITAHYGASKLRWCLEHIDAVRQAHDDGRLYWGPLASFLVYHLTREHRNLVDPANASRTLLWGLARNDWQEALLQLFEIPRAPLPQCVESTADYGTIAIDAMRIPLRVVMGDQPAALMGYSAAVTDNAYINMGTGAFIQRPTGKEIKFVDRLLTGVVMIDEDGPLYDLECTVNGAGSALTKIEEQLGMDVQQAEDSFSDWLAQAVDPPLFLNGVSGVGSPYWIPDFESRFVGEGEPWEKIVAVAESILFLLQVNLNELQAVSGPLRKLTLTGGLAVSDGLCQRLANLSGLSVFRPEEAEATARGVAFVLAGCPGQWYEQVNGQWFNSDTDSPLQARFQRWCQAMENAIADHKGASANFTQQH